MVSYFILSCSKKEAALPPRPPAPVEKPKPKKLELIKYTDGETFLTDSVELVFSKKIKVNYIKSKYEYCMTDDMGFNYISEENGFRFRYSCARLGRSYPFEYSVTDIDGNTLTSTISIDFFTQNFKTEGYTVLNMVISPDNQHIWVTSGKDDGSSWSFMSLSIDSLKVEIDAPIPGASRFMSYNPYNKLVYISAFEDPKVFVVDPSNGKFIKTIQFGEIIEDNYVERNSGPFQIFFAKNGFGVVNMAEGWKAIDSSKDDLVYNPVSTLPGNAQRIGVALINDGTQILARNVWGSELVIIDSEQKDVITLLEHRIHSLSAVFTVNKRNDMILIMANSIEFMDTKTHAVYDHPNNGFFFPLGFTNWSEESPTIYGFVDQSGEINFFISDYSTGENLLDFPAGVNLVKGEATTDGKYLVCLSDRGLFTFSQKMFQK